MLTVNKLCFTGALEKCMGRIVKWLSRRLELNRTHNSTRGRMFESRPGKKFFTFSKNFYGMEQKYFDIFHNFFPRVKIF